MLVSDLELKARKDVQQELKLIGEGVKCGELGSRQRRVNTVIVPRTNEADRQVFPECNSHHRITE